MIVALTGHEHNTHKTHTIYMKWVGFCDEKLQQLNICLIIFFSVKTILEVGKNYKRNKRIAENVLQSISFSSSSPTSYRYKFYEFFLTS